MLAARKAVTIFPSGIFGRLSDQRHEAIGLAYADPRTVCRLESPTQGDNVTDFRSEALRVFNTTSSTDSNRGVIAALLHIADLLGGVPSTSTATPTTADSADWEHVALQYLQDKSTRSKNAERIRSRLAQEGFDVSTEQVSAAMWRLRAEGKVKADTAYGNSTSFSAVR